MRKPLVAPFLLAFLLLRAGLGQSAAPGSAPTTPGKVAQRDAHRVCVDCIRAQEEFLASDAMQGRGSATHDELLAATYIAAQLRQYGIQPAGDDGGYIQSAPTLRAKFSSAPQITVMPAGDASVQPSTLEYGKDFVVQHLSDTKFSGHLQKIEVEKLDSNKVKIGEGNVVLIFGSDKTGSDKAKIRRVIEEAISAGATGALVGTAKRDPEDFEENGEHFPELPVKLATQSQGEMGFDFNLVQLSAQAVETLARMPEGSEVSFAGASKQEDGHTWNAVGILRGSDPALRHSAILLSAHLDHLGIGKPVNGDDIYNGADDDASGTTAVLELARVLGKGPRPRRTVIFALFGSEEEGGLGSTYFREHPPIPLKDIAANLEFEMIGRADPVVKADTVWLTGWERSNLGPTLAKHGANLVGDPHPDQNFFARSDNYVLAKKGVVAQTVSSYGLHKDYHQPSDDVAHLDFKHMDAAIGSLLGPVEWLVNSNFKPTWNKGGQP